MTTFILAMSLQKAVGGGLIALCAVAGVVVGGKELSDRLPARPAPQGGVGPGAAPAPALTESELRSANDLAFKLGAIARRHPDDAQRKAALGLLHQLEGVLTGASDSPPAVENSGNSGQPAGRSLLS